MRLAPEEKAKDAGEAAKKPAGGVEEKPPGVDEKRSVANESPVGEVGETETAGGVTKGGEAPAATPEKGAEAAQTKKVAEPALSGSVRAIARFAGGVYVASYGRGLERFLGPGRRELVWPRAGQDERGREVVSLYADESRGRLWVGTANAGVFYFDGSTVKAEPALAPLGQSTVWGVSYAEGWLWLATSRGLYALGPGGRFVALVGGVDARAVVASEGAGVPRAWCVTAGIGLLRVVLDEQFGPIASRLGTEQGLPTDNAFAVLRAQGETAETLLVGTTGGLARYEPGTLAPVLRLVRVTSSRAIQPEELQGGGLRLQYPQNGLALDVAAAASRTFPEQFFYAFTLRDAKGQRRQQKLSRDSQFQAESLAAGAYTVTARAYTLDLVPSDTLVLNFEVARAPFPRTIVALSVLLAFALVALVWAFLQHRRVVRSREELQEANHQLAAARLQLASEAEAERRRIARDLHDQTLADLRRLLLLTDEMQQPGGANGAQGALVASTTGTTGDDGRRRAAPARGDRVDLAGGAAHLRRPLAVGA